MSPPARHFTSKNRSAPMSEPKPASVTTTSAWDSAIRSAITDDVPVAMLPNGPAVHERRPALEGLEEVGLDRVLEDHGHRAGGA